MKVGFFDLWFRGITEESKTVKKKTPEGRLYNKQREEEE